LFETSRGFYRRIGLRDTVQHNATIAGRKSPVNTANTAGKGHALTAGQAVPEMEQLQIEPSKGPSRVKRHPEQRRSTRPGNCQGNTKGNAKENSMSDRVSLARPTPSMAGARRLSRKSCRDGPKDWCHPIASRRAFHRQSIGSTKITGGLTRGHRSCHASSGTRTPVEVRMAR
jgi:hypothetical protein